MTRVTTHPGEVLRLEFLEPFGMTAQSLAAAIHVPLPRVESILEESRGIDADTAIRLGKAFGTSSEFWLNLQQAHDLSKARSEGDFEGIEQVGAA